MDDLLPCLDGFCSPLGKEVMHRLIACFAPRLVSLAHVALPHHPLQALFALLTLIRRHI